MFIFLPNKEPYFLFFSSGFFFLYVRGYCIHLVVTIELQLVGSSHAGHSRDVDHKMEKKKPAGRPASTNCIKKLSFGGI